MYSSEGLNSTQKEFLLDASTSRLNYFRSRKDTQMFDDLVNQAPLGQIYPDSYYSRSPFWKFLKREGVVNISLPAPLGDSILSFACINHLKQMREITGVPFQINLGSKQTNLLRGYYEYDSTIQPHLSHGFSYNVPLINFGSRIDRILNTYHIPLVPHTTHPIMPLNRNGSLRTVSELMYRALELTTGVKTQDTLADLDYTLPLPPLSLEETARLPEFVQALNGKDKYIVAGNMASHRTKCFGDEQFLDIIAGIQDAYVDTPVVYIRDPHDNDIETQALLKEYVSRSGRQVVFVKEDLHVLANMMNGAQFALFPDTGIAHLAAALKIPTVVGFTAAHPDFWRYPQGTYIPVSTPYAASLRAKKIDQNAWLTQKHPSLRGSKEFTYMTKANGEEGLVKLGPEPFIRTAISAIN